MSSSVACRVSGNIIRKLSVNESLPKERTSAAKTTFRTHRFNQSLSREWHLDDRGQFWTLITIVIGFFPFFKWAGPYKFINLLYQNNHAIGKKCFGKLYFRQIFLWSIPSSLLRSKLKRWHSWLGTCDITISWHLSSTWADYLRKVTWIQQFQVWFR